MSLAAGRLRHRVTLESLTTTQDADTGALIQTWVGMGTVWAGVEPLSVRDFLSADSRQSQIVARIVMRPVAGMDETWRIVHRDKIYQIKGILPDAESGLEYVTIAVSQGANEAGG